MGEAGGAPRHSGGKEGVRESVLSVALSCNGLIFIFVQIAMQLFFCRQASLDEKHPAYANRCQCLPNNIQSG